MMAFPGGTVYFPFNLQRSSTMNDPPAPEIVRLAYLTRDDFGFTLWVSPADNEWPAVPSWTVVKRGKGTTAKSSFKDRSGENLEFPLMMTDVEQLYPEALRLVPNSSAIIPLRLTFHQDLKASEAFHPEWSDNP